MTWRVETKGSFAKPAGVRTVQRLDETRFPYLFLFLLLSVYLPSTVLILQVTAFLLAVRPFVPADETHLAFRKSSFDARVNVEKGRDE